MKLTDPRRLPLAAASPAIGLPAAGPGLAATRSRSASSPTCPSLYADIDGPGGAEAIKMAIADLGGKVAGKKIEVLVADHQNKADVAASKAREWFDKQGLDMLIGGTNSGTAPGHGQGRGREEEALHRRSAPAARR